MIADEVKGTGLGYKLISLIEDKAKELGYKRMYLETHSNLAVAIPYMRNADLQR